MSPFQNETETVEITRLDNGLTVVTDPSPGVYTATVGLWVGAGSRHEQENEHGLSHLIEHMAFKGTARRSALQIAEDIENIGGDINAATTAESTGYSVRVLGDSVPVAVDVLADILLNATLADDELAREKNVILQEYAAVEDTPDDLVYDAFLETAFAAQPLGRPVIGTPRTIAPMTAAGIRAFLEREYVPERMVLAAGGAVRHAEMVELAHRFFGGLTARQAPPAAPGRYTGGNRRIRRKLEQLNIVIGFPGYSHSDDRHYAAHMFAHILGGSLTSRLWREVRETRGLAYEIGAFHWTFSDCGILGIGGAAGEKDARDYLNVVRDTVFQTVETLSPAELERARAQTKVGILTALENPAGRTALWARQLMAWGRLISSTETVRIIDALTLDDIRAVGREMLAGQPTFAAIGPVRALPAPDAVFPPLR
ncbi:MAG: insulinase family protein [Methylobacteriaceae bacterium]|nr:insulinase family protein [Methylobacteriaceae bacterium]